MASLARYYYYIHNIILAPRSSTIPAAALADMPLSSMRAATVIFKDNREIIRPTFHYTISWPTPSASHHHLQLPDQLFNITIPEQVYALQRPPATTYHSISARDIVISAIVRLSFGRQDMHAFVC